MQTAIERVRNVKMPLSVETRSLRITGSGCCSVESDGGSSSVATNACWKCHVCDSFGETDVIDVLPALAEIIRCSHDRVRASGSAEEIYPAVVINSDSGISSRNSWCRKSRASDGPSRSVILRDNYCLFSTAVLVWHIDSAIHG